jgi:quinoprotein glucose dehydrogenase
MITRLYAVFLILIGLALAGGGIWLTVLGGSAYYLIAGALTIFSGVLVWRGDPRAPKIYAAMLAGTLAWALWEAGLDGWALVGRLAAPVVLGLGMIALSRIARRRILGRLSALMLIAGLAGFLLHRMSGPEPADPLYQAGWAVAPAQRTVAAGPLTIAEGEWRHYGNDAGGTRFSPLRQLTAATVSGLKPAWSLNVGHSVDGTLPTFEATPLKIGPSLYFCTGFNDVLSVDAETGKVNWRFRSHISLKGRPSAACRGVAYHKISDYAGPCAERILTNTVDARLIALDARTGRKCPGFGRDGSVSLLDGMGSVPVGYYYVSSAPTVIRNRIVLGGWVSDGQYWGEPSGVVRAYDVLTGKFSWAFDVGRPGEYGEPAQGESYTHSTPNSWAPMSADEKLGLVYVPTGNATPDYYGAQRRSFDDKYSSSVVALDASTGAPRWSFQTAHHDLWDYDVPAQPTLIDIPIRGAMRPALIQGTKRGELFILDRRNGRPLFPVVEKAVPVTGAAPGERVSATQPFTLGLPSFRGPHWRERDMWGITPVDQLWCRIRFRQARYGGAMTPPGLTPSIAFPGYMGGIDWGGVSVDPDRGLLIVNANRMGNYNRLITRAEADARGLAPKTIHSKGEVGGAVPQANTPFAAQVGPFLSPLGVPCTEPPFGLIAAIDLNTGKLVWKKPLGTIRDTGPLGIPAMLPIEMGVPNVGGSVVTRGGLTFIAATQERTLRALDTSSGREIWSARLPAGGQATPMTYWSDRSNRQFVIIAAGGKASLGSRKGDALIAFALPIPLKD